MNKKKEYRKHNSTTKKNNLIIDKSKRLIQNGILFLIIVVTFISYLPVLNNSFTNWDDNSYILNNFLIRSVNLKEIFSHNWMGNYHPFTMLVYSIEYHFFNVNEKGYFMVNLLIHLINTFLVYKVVLNLSNKSIVAMVAMLFFGIHPIHVESVAWASELKDLLYTLFFLSSFIFYLKYLKYQKKIFYYFSLILFLVSLLSKAMAVSLPLILILADYFKGRKINKKILIEKIPFLTLSLIFGVVAVLAQRSFGAMDSTIFPLLHRIVFASYAFITYLIKLVVPVNLCSYYPYPINPGEAIPLLYYLYLVVIVLFAGLILYFRRNIKIIFFGICFFLFTVFLVLQLLPVGETIMADRYCYIPSIGIFFLAGEFFYWLWNKKKFKIPAIVLTVVLTVFYSIQTYARCGVWKDGMTLWNDVIQQYENVPIAYNNRGYLKMNEEKYEEALSDFSKAIELKPDYADAYNNRAVLKKKTNRNDEILSDLNKAIELKPNYVDAYNNRGIVFTIQKKYEEAIRDFNKSIELQPNFGDVYSNRGIAEFNSGKINEACLDFQKAIRLGNQNAAYLFNNYCK